MGEERIGARALASLRERLSERDHAILRSVRDHRFLTTKQIARLHFADHATELAGIRACVRVLARLRDHRLLTRLDRQVGGVRAGSSSYVWCLDVVGERLVRPDGATAGDVVRKRFFEPSTVFLAHTLAVAETRLSLEEAARAGTFALVELATEPASWRHYVGSGGATHVLKPDLFAITSTDEWEDHWFIEVDLGSESIPVLILKCHQYERYRQSGREQAQRGVFPAVLWVLRDGQRRARLRAAVAGDDALDPRLFQVIGPEDLSSFANPESVAAARTAT